MMQGFTVIGQSRLEYNKGSFKYDVSRQGGGGVSRFLIFLTRGEGGGGDFCVVKYSTVFDRVL